MLPPSQRRQTIGTHKYIFDVPSNRYNARGNNTCELIWSGVWSVDSICSHMLKMILIILSRETGFTGLK